MNYFYFFMLALVTTFNAQAESCSFPNRLDLLNLSDCAKIDVSINKTALSKIKFDSNGLAGGSIENLGCFWLNRNGVMKKTICYDNGADYFSNGLARYIDSNGLFGYMNTDLKVVIRPQFTFAFPFKGSSAWVCNGCKTVASKESEYSKVAGGKWMTIDRKGKITKCKKAFDYQSCI